MRVVGVDVPDSPCEAECHIQQQGWTERVRVVDGEQVGVGPSRTALARVSEVLKAVEAHSMAVLVRVFHADQVLLVETVVDLDVVLIVVVQT